MLFKKGKVTYTKSKQTNKKKKTQEVRQNAWIGLKKNEIELCKRKAILSEIKFTEM